MRLSAFESGEHSSLVEENRSLKAKVRKLTLENEDLSLQADKSIEIINSLKLENEDLNESLSHSQRALSEAYRASSTRDSILAGIDSDESEFTEEDISEIDNPSAHSDVLGQLRQAIDRLERLKDSKPTRK